MNSRRLVSMTTLLTSCLTIVLCRVFWIGTDTEYAQNAVAQTQCDIALPAQRGNFYDRSGRQLTGGSDEWYALCVPGDSSYATLFPYVGYEQQKMLYAKRNSAAPFLVQVDRDLSANGIFTASVEKRYFSLPIAPHLIGYLDGDDHGVAGLEQAYDTVLYRKQNSSVIECSTTAQGSLLAGEKPKLVQTAEQSAGVELTLEEDLQRSCEGIAALTMQKGCIVVMDTATGQVLASVSQPVFDPQNVGKSIAAQDTSLINRTFAAFNAGSVFKVVLATAAYEHGLDWYTWDCTGSTEVAGQTYRCAKSKAHGTVNLRGALEQSCNCYFIQLGQLLGADTVYEAAKDFGFGLPTAVAPGLKTSAGNLPQAATLQNIGQLCNFSFGQGELTVTPLQITAMMNVIADGGLYRTPTFVLGTLDANKLLSATQETAAPRRVCSADTARIMRSMLVSVVEDGIGKQALPAEGGAGGKTGTAQTGQFTAEKEELLNYWFTGFYPADDPRYTITVLQDNTLEPQSSSAAIFAKVANTLAALENAEN